MKKIKIFTFLLFLFGLGNFSLWSQTQTEVIGKVVDSQKEPLIGVRIAIKGKTVGTTDIDGNYKIQAMPDDALVFSYLGMKDKSVNLNGRKILNVTLDYAAVEMEEVVAIGYGTMKRRDLTSAISSVQAKDIENIPVTNAAQALAGKISGVQVTQAQGSPDSEISIRVRGGISITQDNDPLYIIDGFPAEDGLRMIDPSDIATIDVLKDASATAIYGARGANGVIVITTKSGAEGKATINFDMYVGFKKISKYLDVLNSEQFVKLEYERVAIGNNLTEKQKIANIYGPGWDSELSESENLYNFWNSIPGTYAGRPGVDWQKEVFGSGTPLTQNYKVSVNGGNKDTKYNASYAWNSDDGIMDNSGFQRHNIRMRLDQKLSSKLKFAGNVNYVDETTEGLGSLQDGGQFGRLTHVIQSRPVSGYVDEDAGLITQQSDPYYDDDSGNQIQNPIISTLAEKRTRANKITTLNGELSYQIIKNLTYKGVAGLRHREYQDEVFYTEQSRQAINAGAPYGYINRTDYDSWSISNTLTYVWKIDKKQSFDAMIGQEYWQQDSYSLLTTSNNFPRENFGLDDMSLGITPGVPKSVRYTEKLLSFFGRVNYNLQQKYLAMFTLRADGSSKFGANHKWGVFPSGSLAWRASEEEFVRNWGIFSNLKLRFGYGTAGNNRIANYLSMSKMTSSWMAQDKQMATSYYSSQLPNPDLKWETDITTNLGLDFGFLDQRIQMTVDLYNNSTKDLLLNSKIPLFSGYPSTMKNIGKTRNRGIEISLTTYNIRTKDFEWVTNFNISANKNKVIALAESDYFTEKSLWSKGDFNEEDYYFAVGQPTGQMYGYVDDGIYTVEDFNFDPVSKTYTPEAGLVYDEGNVPQPGSWKYKDTSGDGKITSDDKEVIGNANPDCFGGMTNTFTYKDFDFSFMLSYQIGNEVYNANRMYFSKLTNKGRNVLEDSSNRFTYIDGNGDNVLTDPVKLAALNQGKIMAAVNPSSTLKLSSYFVEDGSFLKLSNITLGYTLPKPLVKKVGINNLRIYATAYNLLTLTGYSGYDPEVNTKPNGGLTPGIDWGAYPRAYSFVGGLNLTF